MPPIQIVSRVTGRGREININNADALALAGLGVLHCVKREWYNNDRLRVDYYERTQDVG